MGSLNRNIYQVRFSDMSVNIIIIIRRQLPEVSYVALLSLTVAALTRLHLSKSVKFQQTRNRFGELEMKKLHVNLMCIKYTYLIHLNTIRDAFGSTSKLKSSLCFFNVNLKYCN